MGPGGVLIICRSAIFAAALLLWGASAFRWRLLPDAGRMGFESWAVAVLAVAVAVLLPVQVAGLAGGWGDALDPEMVWAVISSTTNGKAWALQAAATCVVVLAFIANRTGVILAAVTLVFVAQSMTGHAASSEGWVGLLRQANDTLHLVAAGAWLGALPYVLRLLPRLHQPETRAVLIRYSGEGHFWVALVLVTGLIATLWIFEGVPTDVSVRYQLLWWFKVSVSLAIVGLAIRNRYFLVPRLGEGPMALSALAKATRGEIALGFIAVALVAWFGTLEPR